MITTLKEAVDLSNCEFVSLTEEAEIEYEFKKIMMYIELYARHGYKSIIYFDSIHYQVLLKIKDLGFEVTGYDFYRISWLT